MKLEIIKSIILEIPFVKQLNKIEQREFSIVGNVEISFEELENSLTFDFKIDQEYPLKSYESESIKFWNEELVAYNHVMQSGNICIHTSHSTNIKEKLRIDFNALKEWVIKYYINKDLDLNYEHIVVNESPINDKYYSFIFTETDKAFIKGELGTVSLSLLNNGLYRENLICNFYVQNFKSASKEIKLCQWNKFYHQQNVYLEGLYYFLGEAPAINNRFAYSYWQELNLPINLIKLLDDHEQANLEHFKGKIFPFFLGYNICETEVHWQVALLEIGKFPLKGVAERVNGHKTGKWLTSINEEKNKLGNIKKFLL